VNFRTSGGKRNAYALDIGGFLFFFYFLSLSLSRDGLQLARRSSARITICDCAGEQCARESVVMPFLTAFIRLLRD